jgi:hypothetical protein
MNDFEREEGNGFDGWNKEDEERLQAENNFVANIDIDDLDVLKESDPRGSPSTSSNRPWTAEDEEREIENLKKSLLAVAV